MIREITLLVDDDDYRDITTELHIRDSRMMPDAELGSNIAGRCVGEIVRDLWEYRALALRGRDPLQGDGPSKEANQ